jgi:hypothetical protein
MVELYSYRDFIIEYSKVSGTTKIYKANLIETYDYYGEVGKELAEKHIDNLNKTK